MNKDVMEHPRPHFLFVCGRNRWRSPTAERLYRNDSRIAVRSAGVSEKSPHPLSGADIEWADLILVMEEKYAAAIREKFRRSALPPIRSLDIPDEYQFMDAELVELIRRGVEIHIGQIKR
jgi:predicted protein tyrosine phosphatase